jgi:DNA-directed RNA polymerase specialized sigma24 family protein
MRQREAKAAADAARAAEDFQHLRAPFGPANLEHWPRGTVDAWLWRHAKERLRDRIRARKKYHRSEKERTQKLLANQQHRDQIAKEPIDRLIRAVYWHEVNRPGIPISAFR